MIEFKKTFRRLNVTEPKTHALVEQESNRKQQENTIFGATALQAYDSAEAKGLDVQNSDLLVWERGRLADIVSWQEKESRRPAFQELSRLINDYVMMDEDKGETITKALAQSDPKNNEVVAELVRIHVTEMEKRRQMILEDEIKYKAIFTKSVFAAIEAGWLPIDKQKAAEKIQRIPPVVIPDVFTQSIPTVRAHYDVGEVLINPDTYSRPDTTDELRQHMWFHEWTHFLSGENLAQMRTTTTLGDGREVTTNTIKGFKLGLQFKLPGHGAIPPRKFGRGLNEAVADTVAQRLQGRSNDFGYSKERKELQRLIETLHVSERVILEAFFEDSNPELERNPKASQPAAPAYGRFIREVNQKAGRDFIKNLK